MGRGPSPHEAGNARPQSRTGARQAVIEEETLTIEPDKEAVPTDQQLKAFLGEESLEGLLESETGLPDEQASDSTFEQRQSSYSSSFEQAGDSVAAQSLTSNLDAGTVRRQAIANIISGRLSRLRQRVSDRIKQTVPGQIIDNLQRDLSAYKHRRQAVATVRRQQLENLRIERDLRAAASKAERDLISRNRVAATVFSDLARRQETYHQDLAYLTASKDNSEAQALLRGMNPGFIDRKIAEQSAPSEQSFEEISGRYQSLAKTAQEQANAATGYQAPLSDQSSEDGGEETPESRPSGGGAPSPSGSSTGGGAPSPPRGSTGGGNNQSTPTPSRRRGSSRSRSHRPTLRRGGSRRRRRSQHGRGSRAPSIRPNDFEKWCEEFAFFLIS